MAKMAVLKAAAYWPLPKRLRSRKRNSAASRKPSSAMSCGRLQILSD